MRRVAPQFISRSLRFSATSAVIFLFVSFVPLRLNFRPTKTVRAHLKNTVMRGLDPRI
jgi:hypothetical protein